MPLEEREKKRGGERGGGKGGGEEGKMGGIKMLFCFNNNGC